MRLKYCSPPTLPLVGLAAFAVLSLLVCSDSISCQTDEGTEYPVRRASGTVVDFLGRPVAGATVCFATWVGGEEVATLATTDSDGEFEIEYQQAFEHELFHTWAFAEGHAVRTVNMRAKFKPNHEASNVKIRLPKLDPYQFRIVTPDGQPYVNRVVKLHSANVPNGRFAADEPTGLTVSLPTPVAEFVQAKTDEDGIVTFTRFSQKLALRYSVESLEFGR